MDTLKFELARQTIPVELIDENRQSHSYELREMDGLQRDTYMNKSRTKIDLDRSSGDKAMLKTFEGLYSLLLSFTLFDVVNNRYCAEAEIQKFPTSVQEQLHKAAKSLNGFDVETEGKN